MVICAVEVLAEMTIYAATFAFLYRHDKGMASMLPEHTIKQRKRKNVIELSGHFIHFVYEMMVTVTFS